VRGLRYLHGLDNERTYVVALSTMALEAAGRDAGPGDEGEPSRAVTSRAPERERAQAARDNLMKEERALLTLLVADNSTRPAVEAQTVKANDARVAFTKVRLDLLWELRSVIPAQNRAQAFRCAEFSLVRRR